jgi:hypothetical protein
VEAVDFDEAAELVGSGGVLRIDSADALERAGIAFEDAGEVAVVPLVVDDLDDDGAGDPVGAHQFEELFDCGIFGGRIGSGCERECGIVFPDVDVGVDEGLRSLSECRYGECCGGSSEEAAAGEHL